MASESKTQPSLLPPSYLPMVNSSDSYEEITPGISSKPKKRSLLHRLFGNLHAVPFNYTDELKPYSVNGCNVNKTGRTILTKK